MTTITEAIAVMPTNPVELGQRRRIGPIVLGPDVLPRHAFAYVYVAIATVTMVGFFPLMQPYVLATRLHLPQAVIGRTVSQMAIVQSMAVLIFVTIFGAIADRVRCNRFVGLSTTIMSVACFSYPFATTLTQLKCVLFLLGIGQVAGNVSLASTTMAYPDNASRGKYGSLIDLLMTGGTALMLGQVGTRLPKWFAAAGLSPAIVLRDSFWCVGALGIPATFIAIFAMKQDRKVVRTTRLNLRHEFQALLRNLRSVFAFSRTSRPFRLVLTASLLTKSDYAVMMTFLSLWVSSVGRTHGIEASLSLKRVGTVFTIIQFATLVGMCLYGLLIDKLNREKLLLAALGVITLAFLSPIVAQNIFLPIALLSPLLIGFAEGSLSSSQGALLAQETPPSLRGSTTGVVNLIGIVGVSLLNYVGGIVYDRFSPIAPFVLMACLNLCVFVASFILLRTSRTLHAVALP